MSDQQKAANYGVECVVEATKECEASPPLKITLHLDEMEYTVLVAALQLVLRHPQYRAMPSSHITRDTKDKLINLCPIERPMLRHMLELGDNPKFDVKR